MACQQKMWCWLALPVQCAAHRRRATAPFRMQLLLRFVSQAERVANYLLVMPVVHGRRTSVGVQGANA